MIKVILFFPWTANIRSHNYWKVDLGPQWYNTITNPSTLEVEAGGAKVHGCLQRSNRQQLLFLSWQLIVTSPSSIAHNAYRFVTGLGLLQMAPSFSVVLQCELEVLESLHTYTHFIMILLNYMSIKLAWAVDGIVGQCLTHRIFPSMNNVFVIYLVIL